MPDATLNDAIKEAYSCCPTNQIVWETLQFSHPSLPDGDIWVVRNREDLTLGLERGGPGSAYGSNPGEPGPEVEEPDEVDDPGPAPERLPIPEPVASNYYVVGEDDTVYSVDLDDFLFPNEDYPEDPELSGTVADNWYSYYDDWQTDPEDTYSRDRAAYCAGAIFAYDHNRWDNGYTEWAAEKALYDAYVLALAAHEAWEDDNTAYNTWLANTENEELLQLFEGRSFDLTRSASGENGIQELSFTCCNADRAISDWLDQVSGSASNIPIEVTLRVYVESDTSRPAIDPPTKLYLTDAKIDIATVACRASFADVVNKAYPNAYYTRKLFPSLGN